MRDFLGALVREIFPEPAVTVTGSHYVDVTCNTKGKMRIVNLINTSGPHDNEKVMVHDEITPLGPLQVTIRSESKPASVMLQPENIILPYTFENGAIVCTVPKLAIHEMIVVQ
jgi:hypothetical protein